jgi:predicted Zn-dependent protease
MIELIIYYKLSFEMNFKYILILIISIGSSGCFEYDDIAEINNKVWSKNVLTWSFVNHPTHLNPNYKDAIYYEFLGAFQAWEKISPFRFDFLMNSTDADIIIIFAPPKHRLFEGDHHFNPDSLAHAHFPENGDIHLNDNVKWSLSFKNEPNTINMFYVIAHEIGHSLGLNHISDPNSIMFPAYIKRNEDAFNFTFEPIDEQLIKNMYSNFYTTTTVKTQSTTGKTIKPMEKITEPTVPTTTSNIKAEDFYPEFTLCKQKVIDWCNDDLNFNLIYDIEGYLFLYKSSDFWIFSDKTGIKSRKFHHFVYWTSNFVDLISIIKIENDFVLFYETHTQILSCDRAELNLNYSRFNIPNRINGVFYNYSTDILYLFSKETPKTYYKLINFTTNKPRSIIKPISLWKMDIFDYDVVFSRKNVVYFVKKNIIDYFDFNLNISVKGIEFKDLFLRDDCELLPLAKDFTNNYFNSTLI